MPGCIFALFIGFVFIILSFVLNIVRMFWSVRKAANQFMKTGQRESTSGRNTFDKEETAASTDDAYSSSSSSKKTGNENHRDKNGRFFEHDEGVYVDFEEVKD